MAVVALALAALVAMCAGVAECHATPTAASGTTTQAGRQQVADDTDTQTVDVSAVQGGVAKLLCDIVPSVAGDKMQIMVWYKDGENRNLPIYSFDARKSQLEEGRHWAYEAFNGRLHFRFEDSPAMLMIDNVKESDAGLYHYRVDFKTTPTRHGLVNLSIIIPPEKLSVLDETGHHIPDYVLGPYNEGSSINITCVATGGRPPPNVTWWQENFLLSNDFQQLPERRVKNVLHLDKLERKHFRAVFTCQATNHIQVTPISSSIRLNMNLRPLRVRLIGENKPLSAGHTYELSCEVVGTHPEPTITWWKGSTQMKNTREMTSKDKNETTSVLTFTPTVEDGGKYLSCRGQHPQIADSGMEDGWKLDIHHIPLVTLELGSTLNGSTIKEGVDVYFECNIKSNPWVYKVSWKHNGKPLYNSVQSGTIVSNQSLVLQSITRARSGPYTCVGHNQEGDGESNTMNLDVKFAPTCRPGQPRSFGVARGETARIACELEANPADVEVTWQFNSSASQDDTAEVPASNVHTEGARSVASFRPATEQDYGTLLCWGRNEIGRQKEPCVFYINPAGKPDALSNCTTLNQTAESLTVECDEGFDGGLPQEFVMEVFDALSRKLVSNVTSKVPYFAVGGLESGSGFEIGLYAVNKKGRSPVSHLPAFTLKSAQRHIAAKQGPPRPPRPENCTLVLHTATRLRVACAPPTGFTDPAAVYLAQVYDANSRHLRATTTAQFADILELQGLPDDRRDLLVFVRTIDGRSTTSDSNIIYVPAIKSEHRRAEATTPVLLQITPLLGALIGVVAALILVAVIIVAFIRCRGGGGSDRHDKDYDDGGLSAAGRRCVAGNNSDKASTEPLNKELNDSVDSLDEKNPDIIPQNNADDEYQDEERAFDRLNNAPSLRVYSRMQSPTTQQKNGSYVKQLPPHVIYSQHQAIPMSVIRRPEATVYAQLDMKRVGVCPQPLSPPHFQTLHHPLPHVQPYAPRTIREEAAAAAAAAAVAAAHAAHDGSVGSETPLLSRETNPLQTLLEVSNARTPTITSTLPRTVAATRF